MSALLRAEHSGAPVTLYREVRVVAEIITVEGPENACWTVAPDVGGDVEAVLQQFWPNNPALRPLVYREELESFPW